MTRYIIIVQCKNRRSPSGGNSVYRTSPDGKWGKNTEEVVSSRVFTGMGEQGILYVSKKRDLRI